MLAKATPLQLKEDNIPEIVSAMTVEEKCALLVGGEASSSWVTERGRYTFIVGKNASDRGLRRKVRV